MQTLPKPTETLFDCCWLPRILAKARLYASGQLDPAYAKFFCGDGSVDAYFIDCLGITRDLIVEAASLSAEDLERSLHSLPEFPQKRKKWNALGPKLGRVGYPMEARLEEALRERYTHLAGKDIRSVFEMLEADEAKDNGSTNL
jgi:hypothetical protein